MAIGVTGLTVHTQVGSGTWENVPTGGSGSGINTDVFFSSTSSRAKKISNSQAGFVYQINASGADLSNTIIAVRWATLAGVGTLASLALDGVQIVLKDTSANYSYFTIAGSDTYQGGWRVSVVDTSLTETSNSGTAATLTAIEFVGIRWNQTSNVGGGDPNCYIDEIISWPNSGLTITGDTTALIADLQTWDDTSLYGVFETRAGITFSKAKLILSPGVTGFSSTDEFIVFEDAIYEDGTSVDSAYSSHGISSASANTISLNRFSCLSNEDPAINGASSNKSFDFGSATDIDMTTSLIKGFVHATANTSLLLGAASNTYNNLTIQECGSGTHTTGSTLTDCFLRTAATADGVEALTTTNLDNFVRCSFEFSDGHALELTSIGTYGSNGNKFVNYGADGTNDAAIYNNSGGAVTINVTNLGDTPTVRNGTGASTTINNAVNLTVNVEDEAGSPVQSARVAIYDSTNTELMNELTTAAGIATESYAYTADESITVRIRKSSSGTTRYLLYKTTGTITANGYTLTAVLIEDNIASA